MRGRGLVALVCCSACGSPVAPSSSTGSGSGTVADVSTSAASSSSAAYTTSAAGSSTDSTTTGETTNGCGFICDDPTGPGLIECTVIDDTCPSGEKCNYYANDGGTQWNATKCFPVVERPDAVDAECMVFGNGASALDSCDRGSMCLYADPDTDLGECVPFCIGPANYPVCDDPYRECSINSSILLFCYPDCDPLAPETCAPGEACYAVDGDLRCRADASGRGGGPLSPCEFINACEAGSTCTPAAQVGACPPDADDCCAPFCDLSAPDFPRGTTCTPFFEKGTTPPGSEDLGLCGTGAR